jgi:hypothetical protein
LFNFISIKQFLVFIENDKNYTYDFLEVARFPNYVPGYQEMPNYRVWSGPGYGASLTAGLKIAINYSVSIDPVFQLSVCSFGNSKNNLPGFNTNLCFNYMVGLRIVMCDATFVTFGKRENTPWKGGNSVMPIYRRCKSGNCRAY